MKDPDAFQLLLQLSKNSGDQYFNWSKIPSNIKAEDIEQLEKLGLIFTKNYSEYVILNGKTKEILTLIDN